MGGYGIGIAAPFLEHMLGNEGVIVIDPPDDDDIIIEPNTLTLELPVPPLTTSGDMLAALISTDADPTITLPAGWTNEDEIGGTAKSYVDLRLSPGGEPATYTWTFDGAEDAIGAILRLINVDPDDPINAKQTFSGTGSTINVPSITTTVARCMLVTLISLNDGVLIDESSLKANKQASLWVVNSSGAAIGSVGSSASYKTLKKAGTEPAYNLSTQGAVSTDYYGILLAFAPDTEVLSRLVDSGNDLIQDSLGNQILVG